MTDEDREAVREYIDSHRGVTDEADAVAALLDRLEQVERECETLRWHAEAARDALDAALSVSSGRSSRRAS